VGFGLGSGASERTGAEPNASIAEIPLRIPGQSILDCRRSKSLTLPPTFAAVFNQIKDLSRTMGQVQWASGLIKVCSCGV
jgi:hypothetical protein